MSKATALAYTIQRLVKYHGLKDSKRPIPFHDSISVCENIRKYTNLQVLKSGVGGPAHTIGEHLF